MDSREDASLLGRDMWGDDGGGWRVVGMLGLGLASHQGGGGAGGAHSWYSIHNLVAARDDRSAWYLVQLAGLLGDGLERGLQGRRCALEALHRLVHLERAAERRPRSRLVDLECIPYPGL